MQVRLAVLVVAAIVLAPALWEGADPIPPSPGDDLTARMLAPSFDEAGLRDGSSHLLPGRRDAKLGARSRHGVAPQPLLAAALFGLLTLHLVAGGRRRSGWVLALAGSPSRAPPALRVT